MAQVNWRGADILARARMGAMRGVAAAAEDVRGEAIRLILETTKSGRVYVRRSTTHQASAPGEPPASDTGRLVNSIRVDPSRLDQLVATVVAGTGYAAHLEYGTARMAARPFMRPALANRRRAIESIVAAHVRAAIRTGP